MFKALRQKTPPPAVEQRNILLSGKEISYTLKRSGKRRSIGLRIDDRGLTVNVPLRASEKWLYSVLQDKADWVVQKLDGWQSRKAPPIVWADGACIPFPIKEGAVPITDFLYFITQAKANNFKVALHCKGSTQTSVCYGKLDSRHFHVDF